MDPQSQTQNPERVPESPAPTPSVPVVPPIQPQKSNMLLILTGLILILLSGGGGFYLGNYVFPSKPSLTPAPTSSPVSSPTPTPDLYPASNGAGATANWLTYINNYIGISFMFPADVEIETDRFIGPRYLDFELYVYKVRNGMPRNFMKISTKKTDEDPQRWFIETFCDHCDQEATIKANYDQSIIYLDGKKVFQYTNKDKDPEYDNSPYDYFDSRYNDGSVLEVTPTLFLVTKHKGQLIRIQVITTKKEVWPDQILSTFKFTE